MDETAILTNLEVILFLLLTVGIGLISATFLCSQKSEINFLRIKLLTHHALIKRLMKDMKLEDGEWILVDNEDIAIGKQSARFEE